MMQTACSLCKQVTIFWRENIKLIDSDERDYLHIKQTANNAIKPILKTLRVEGETEARSTRRTCLSHWPNVFPVCINFIFPFNHLSQLPFLSEVPCSYRPREKHETEVVSVTRRFYYVYALLRLCTMRTDVIISLLIEITVLFVETTKLFISNSVRVYRYICEIF